MTAPENQTLGRVIEIRRELYKLISERGEVSANLRGSFLHSATERSDYPAVGDFVNFVYNPSGLSQIAYLYPRKSKFSRTDFSGHAVGYVKTILEQVVAANFDYVFIMSSLNMDFNVNRIARYLTQARMSGGTPVVILTKSDLCADSEKHIAAVRDIASDVDVIPLSAKTRDGLDKLSKYVVNGKTIVFLGMSGVGKSTLLNALAGEELMSVKEIREDDSRGRHTTTHRQLIKLASGAMIIDTPGMRELGLWDADKGVSLAFADIEDLIGQCRFSDCKHKTEPGCAIAKALKDGTLDKKHWESYKSQIDEVDFVRRKARLARGKR